MFPECFIMETNKQKKSVFIVEAAVIYSSSGLSDSSVKKNVSSGGSFVVINKYHF